VDVRARPRADDIEVALGEGVVLDRLHCRRLEGARNPPRLEDLVRMVLGVEALLRITHAEDHLAVLDPIARLRVRRRVIHDRLWWLRPLHLGRRSLRGFILASRFS
jgi:hypothetical protein